MTSLTEEAAVAAIRGRMVSLTVLEVFKSDLDALDRQLEEKAAQAPSFFRNAPVLLDFDNLEQEVDIRWLDSACGLLTRHYFVPVGITGAAESMEFAARARNIAVWPSTGVARQAVKRESVEHESTPPPPEPVQEEPEPQESPAAEEPAPEIVTETAIHTETLVVRQPVRSGQKIYARGGDLIVLAAVSTGAEVMADGHIHVYGTLRGRALAGVQGKASARIFCHDLQADLVSIAGNYIINEDLPHDKRKTPVQISLRGEQLLIESL